MKSKNQQMFIPQSKDSQLHLISHKKSLKLLKRSNSRSLKQKLIKSNTKQKQRLPFSKTYIANKIISTYEIEQLKPQLSKVQMTKSCNFIQKEKTQEFHNSQNKENEQPFKITKNTTLKNSICTTSKQFFSSTIINKCQRCNQYQYIIACLEEKNLKLIEQNTNLKHENVQRFKQYISKSQAFQQISNIHQAAELHLQSINQDHQKLKKIHQQLQKKYQNINGKSQRMELKRGKYSSLYIKNLDDLEKENFTENTKQIIYADRIPLSQANFIVENYHSKYHDQIYQNKERWQVNPNNKNQINQFMGLIKQLLHKYDHLSKDMPINQEIKGTSLLELTPQVTRQQTSSQ